MRTFPSTSLFICLIGLVVIVSTSAQTADTQYGPVQGFTDDNVAVFHSIPFASPPLGNLRFAPPVPPQPWTETKDVANLPNICPQLRIIDDVYLGNEDCLYLHVYVPANATVKSNLPVMVWLFGGGYILGDGYEFGMYDGKNLAANNNVVVVTPNYRVGAFGFYASPELQQEDPLHRVGNTALLDQRFALQWVQKNIANFGGDPSKVSIFGESAGGFSVCWHLVSPGSAGLFSAAIMESGSCDSSDFFQPLDVSFEYSANYSASIGCNKTDALACMRAASTADIMNSPLMAASEQVKMIANAAGIPTELAVKAATLLPVPVISLMPFGPSIDGVDLPALPLTLLKKGEFNKVPAIFGSNANEGNLFVPAILVMVPGSHFPPTPQDLEAAVTLLLTTYTTNTTIIGHVVDEIMEAYPLSNYNNNAWWRAGAVLTDYFFGCGTRRSARAVAAAGVDMYLYHFTYPASNWIDYDLMGDYHSIELGFVWDNPIFLLHDFDSTEQQVATTMGTYWTNMAKFGKPNAGNVPIQWPRYEQSSYQNLNISWPFTTQTGLSTTMCDMWDEIMKEVTST